MRKPIIFIFFSMVILGSAKAQGPSLETEWTSLVNIEAPLKEYPRPQLVRDAWQNLNGQWNYAILPKGSFPEPGFQGKITVPYAVESLLSGVQKTVGPEHELWYELEFDLALDRRRNKILLHFGAVDWEAEVWINGEQAGVHRGGFDAFSFDITDKLIPGKKQKIRVRVWDPSDSGPQPRGKQVKEPRGIWYTPVTGIWQTVWLESVPSSYLESVYSMTDWENSVQAFYPKVVSEAENLEVEVILRDNQQVVASRKSKVGEAVPIHLENPILWEPDSPFLYEVTVKLWHGKKVLDQVRSYAAYRDISIGKDGDGHERMLLNGKALFHYGPLDQGWWPDGLYTAPTDEALLFDIEKTKEMGFNMIRKHVKVEPARWYYHADKLGMLVWQDMPSGDMGNTWEIRPGVIRGDVNKERSQESEEIFRTEWSEIINEFKFFPSIVVWVPFNEAWGQFKTNEIVELTKTADPSRLINSASGGNFEMDGSDIAGDIMDLHNYPDPVMPDPDIFGANTVLVLGEFGGLGLPLEGHTWQRKDNWGYQSFSSMDELKARYQKLIEDLQEMIPRGLAAAVYTQTTDVEIETNGIMTYDRKVIKLPVDFLQSIHQGLYNQ